MNAECVIIIKIKNIFSNFNEKMEELNVFFEQLDKLGESTPFMIAMVCFGLLFTWMVILRARKDPK